MLHKVLVALSQISNGLYEFHVRCMASVIILAFIKCVKTISKKVETVRGPMTAIRLAVK